MLSSLCVNDEVSSDRKFVVCVANIPKKRGRRDAMMMMMMMTGRENFSCAEFLFNVVAKCTREKMIIL